MKSSKLFNRIVVVLATIAIVLTGAPSEDVLAASQQLQTDAVTQSTNPTIYIAGDSTVQSYKASYAPQQGWGYYLKDYFNNNVSVSNHAIAGRSSKSFYDNGRLTTILSAIKPGDYLFVQFGINDASASNASRYAPVCGSVTNSAVGSFEYYMKFYIEGALQKNATPVLVTTVIGLKAYSNGKFVNSYSSYCQAMKNLAAYYNIPCIDLNSLMVAHYNSIGYNTAYTYHLCSAVPNSTDMTHFTETGANAVAEIVGHAIKNSNIPLSQYVK
jgi:lysophospholipase L1-like esterase